MISLHGGSPPLNSAHINDLIQEIKAEKEAVPNPG